MSVVVALPAVDRDALSGPIAARLARSGMFQHSAAGAVVGTLLAALAPNGAATVDLVAAETLNRSDKSSLVRVLEAWATAVDQAPLTDVESLARQLVAAGPLPNPAEFLRTVAQQVAATDSSPSTLRHS